MARDPKRRPGDRNPGPDGGPSRRIGYESQVSGGLGRSDAGGDLVRAFFAWRDRRKAAKAARDAKAHPRRESGLSDS